MTPVATTPAARGKKKADSTQRPRRTSGPGTGARSTRSAGHARTARPAAPTRRVSGPSGGRPAAGSTARTGAPRRARPAAAKRRRATAAAQPLTARVAAFVRSLPDHSLLDQIVRGRAWIPLLGLLLAGIVAMQVEQLKLGAGLGRALERGTALQSRNEQLRASVAGLSDTQRVERIAAQMGMLMPAPTAVRFLPSTPNGQIGRAVSNIHAPDAATFVAGLPGVTAATPTTATTATATGTPATATPASTATAPGTAVTGTVAAVTPATPTTTSTTTPAAGTTVAPSSGTPATGTASPAASAPAAAPVGGSTYSGSTTATGG